MLSWQSGAKSLRNVFRVYLSLWNEELGHKEGVHLNTGKVFLIKWPPVRTSIVKSKTWRNICGYVCIYIVAFSVSENMCDWALNLKSWALLILCDVTAGWMRLLPGCNTTCVNKPVKSISQIHVVKFISVSVTFPLCHIQNSFFTKGRHWVYVTEI